VQALARRNYSSYRGTAYGIHVVGVAKSTVTPKPNIVRDAVRAKTKRT
jgi:hypothetical protein